MHLFERHRLDRDRALREILGLNASAAPDDNTPRVIKAHAVVRLMGYGYPEPWGPAKSQAISIMYEFVVLFRMARGSNFSKHDRCCEMDIRHHAKVAYGSKADMPSALCRVRSPPASRGYGSELVGSLPDDFSVAACL